MNKQTSKNQYSDYALGEILFSLSPFVLMLIIFAINDEVHQIIYQPEWSFAASVMFGQSVTRLYYVQKRNSESRIISTDRVALFVAAILVFGFAPSIILLENTINDNNPSKIVVYAQIVLFAVSCFVHFISNTLAAGKNELE